MIPLCFLLFLAAVIVCLFQGYSLVWALLTGLALFSLLGLKRGFSAGALLRMAWNKGRDSLIVIPVFLLIGVVMAMWRSCGTIAFFLYYGLRSIPPSGFILMAFLLSALLSYALGTSYGVTGTGGVILITLARSGGVDLAVAAGAILSGAYFGDRCSPMSSCATLVAACTKTDLYDNVRQMLKTAALPTFLTAAVFAVLSFLNPLNTADSEIIQSLSENFHFGWPVLLPALFMLLLPVLRVPVKWAMAISAVCAWLVTILLQGMSPTESLYTAVRGYLPTQEPLARILSGGGLTSMLTTCAIVFITSLYAGILEGTDALASAHKWVEQLCTRLGLFPSSAIVSTLCVAVFCNQSVMVLMDAQLLSDCYRRRGASRTELAMDIANSGVMLAGLVPWSIAITVPLSMLGVGIEAIPWCVLLYLVPLCYFFTRRFFRFSGQSS